MKKTKIVRIIALPAEPAKARGVQALQIGQVYEVVKEDKDSVTVKTPTPYDPEQVATIARDFIQFVNEGISLFTRFANWIKSIFGKSSATQ